MSKDYILKFPYCDTEKKFYEAFNDVYSKRYD